jgi:hypothetical protein
MTLLALFVLWSLACELLYPSACLQFTYIAVSVIHMFLIEAHCTEHHHTDTQHVSLVVFEWKKKTCIARIVVTWNAG